MSNRRRLIPMFFIPVFIGLALLLRSRVAFLAVCAAFVPFLILFFAQFARWKQVL